jgi:hypothetical protein
MAIDDYGNEVYHCSGCGFSFIEDFNEALNQCDRCVASDNAVEVLEEMAIDAGLSTQEPA